MSAAEANNEQFVAFLFDADHALFRERAHYNYAHSSEQPFLEAIAQSPHGDDCHARIVRGDVLMHEVASTLRRFTRNEPAKGKISSSESREYGTDKRRLVTAIGDLADSFAESWCTLDLTDLPSRLGMTNVFCLSAFPISLPLAQSVDKQLRAFTPYLGVVQLDAGNPLHEQLFRRLLDCVYFSGDTLYVSAYDTDEDYYEFGKAPEKHFKLVKLSYSEYQEKAPKFPKLEAITERAALTKERLDSVLAPSHFEKVADELGQIRRGDKNDVALNFQLIPPDADQLSIPVEKLLGYALNLAHKVGKHKAHLFAELLGIEAEQWRYLAYQLTVGLSKARVEDVRVNEFGVQHSVRIPVVGLNERSFTVQTGWIIRPNEPAQLTTAYPAEKSRQLAEAGVRPPWVSLSLKGDDRWSMIHSVASSAAEQAATTCVPMPMKIDGYPIILEGMCGGGWVRVDGRSAFARWLVANGHGKSGYPHGVHVSAHTGTQSAYRAREYAMTYARVLCVEFHRNLTHLSQ